MENVLVLGCHVSGLAVIRALGKMSIPIVAMSYQRTDFADVSKYVSEKVWIPNPIDSEEEFLEFLISNAHRWKGALILETNDYFSVSLSRNKERLQEYYKLVTPDWPILQKFIDKEKTSILAQEAGVPHPKTYTPSSLNHLGELVKDIIYPCILKPARSHEFSTKFGTKNFQIDNEVQLFDKFRLCLDAKLTVMVQEIIPGPDTNLFRLQAYVDSTGTMSAKFFHRKVRQNPPQFGVMRVGVGTERNKDVERLSERLLRYAGYRGYCSIEFRKDPRDNQLKFIEMNVRMPRSGLLAITSGVNFPWLIYSDLVKNQRIEVNDYHLGVYWMELYTDLVNTLFRHNKEQFSLKDYLRPYLAKNKTFAVLSIDDWKPFLKRSYLLPFIALKRIFG